MAIAEIMGMDAMSITGLDLRNRLRRRLVRLLDRAADTLDGPAAAPEATPAVPPPQPPIVEKAGLIEHVVPTPPAPVVEPAPAPAPAPAAVESAPVVAAKLPPLPELPTPEGKKKAAKATKAKAVVAELAPAPAEPPPVKPVRASRKKAVAPDAPTPLADPPAPKGATPAAIKAAESPDERQRKHWSRTRKGLLSFVHEQGGRVSLKDLHEHSERTYFVAHVGFSRMMEELTGEGLFDYDHDTAIATLTDAGRAELG